MTSHTRGRPGARAPHAARPLARARVGTLFLALLPLGRTDAGEAKEFAVRLTEASPVLYIPRHERLVYGVRLGLGVLEATVGTVTMESGVEPYRAPLLLPSAGGEDGPEKELETGWMRARAKGRYAWYTMDASIETRVLPQSWPRFFYRYVHSGSENRRRDLLLGMKDGKWTASYRNDTHEGAPKGTRIWRDPKFRTIPSDSFDLLSAAYLSRTLIREDASAMRFPLIDELDLWQMRVTRGEEREIETGVGVFEAVELLLEPSPLPGEDVEEKTVKRFKGLFGLHGSIHLWVERHTGVPVLIEGDIPVGPFSMRVDISLRSYGGTPAGFSPILREASSGR